MDMNPLINQPEQDILIRVQKQMKFQVRVFRQQRQDVLKIGNTTATFGVNAVNQDAEFFAF